MEQIWLPAVERTVPAASSVECFVGVPAVAVAAWVAVVAGATAAAAVLACRTSMAVAPSVEVLSILETGNSQRSQEAVV